MGGLCQAVKRSVIHGIANQSRGSVLSGAEQSQYIHSNREGETVGNENHFKLYSIKVFLQKSILLTTGIRSLYEERRM